MTTTLFDGAAGLGEVMDYLHPDTVFSKKVNAILTHTVEMQGDYASVPQNVIAAAVEKGLDLKLGGILTDAIGNRYRITDVIEGADELQDMVTLTPEGPCDAIVD